MDAPAKLMAETGLSGQKIILGCIQDFRQMTIVLPENKFLAYPKTILEMLQQGWTSSRELEMNIKRWAHLGQIVLTAHHILSR
jgi:hypothetical protein